MIPIIFAAAMTSQRGIVPQNFECTMRPIPLDAGSIAKSRDVKSFVVGNNKLTASILLKDGAMIFANIGGCEHSWGTVRMLVYNKVPDDADKRGWIILAVKAAQIGLPPFESAGYVKWLEHARPEKDAQTGLFKAEGSPREGLSYEFTVDTYSEGRNAAIITATYYYDL